MSLLDDISKKIEIENNVLINFIDLLGEDFEGRVIDEGLIKELKGFIAQGYEMVTVNLLQLKLNEEAEDRAG